MGNKANLLISVLLILILAVSLIVTAILWNEARKEIFYLCGNFSQGVLRHDVIRQLDTGSFLRYREIQSSEGSSIYVDSQINLGVYSCEIKFDENQKVIAAKFN